MAGLYALAIIVAGVIVVILSETMDVAAWGKSVMRELGAITIAVGVISVFYEVYVRRAFFAELTSASKLADEVNKAGIITVSRAFYQDIDWEGLINGTTQMDLFFSYARTWRNTNRGLLEEYAKRPDHKIRVFLPDSQDAVLIDHLASRFNMSSEELRQAIVEAASDFHRMFVAASRPESLEIWFLKVMPVYSFYRFNEATVLALYNHQGRKVDVPVFVVARHGYLYDFVVNELAYFTAGGAKVGRKVFPADKAGTLPPGMDKAVANEIPTVEYVSERRTE